MFPLWSLRAVLGVAFTSLTGLAYANAAILQAGATDGVSVSIVPTISLIAVIGAAMTVGAFFNRVRELERRIEKLESRWDGTERREGDRGA